MKASEIIASLTKLIALHGDLPVRASEMQEWSETVVYEPECNCAAAEPVFVIRELFDRERMSRKADSVEEGTP